MAVETDPPWGLALRRTPAGNAGPCRRTSSLRPPATYSRHSYSFLHPSEEKAVARPKFDCLDATLAYVTLTW